MSHFPNRKRYTLGIINPSDLLKGIRGGSTGFISSILPYLNAQKVIIFGVSRNDAAPWKPSYIHENVEFVPICKMKHPSKIPMRFKALLNYIYDTGKRFLIVVSIYCIFTCLNAVCHFCTVISIFPSSINNMVLGIRSLCQNIFMQGVFFFEDYSN